MEADESASRADQHSTGVSAVERAKVRAIRLRPGQQDQVGLQVDVDPTAGRTGIGRSLSDSVLQGFEVGRGPHTFGNDAGSLSGS